MYCTLLKDKVWSPFTFLPAAEYSGLFLSGLFVQILAEAKNLDTKAAYHEVLSSTPSCKISDPFMTGELYN